MSTPAKNNRRQQPGKTAGVGAHSDLPQLDGVSGPSTDRTSRGVIDPKQFQQSRTQPIKHEIPGPHTRAGITRVARRIERMHELRPITARALAQRGFRAGKELEAYLHPDLERELGDVWQLKNLDSAVQIVVDALLTGKQGFIAHDYDVDGTTSAAIVAKFLKAVAPEGQFETAGSRRFSGGYGMPTARLLEQARKGTDLFLFLDFGTSATEQVDALKELGKTVVIIDHHDVEDGMPAADAGINPKQKGCGYAGGNLCTAGLAYIFVKALKERLESCSDRKLEKAAAKFDLKSVLPYVAAGTVADVVPLIGLNRALTREGLIELRRTEDAGLQQLMSVTGIGKRLVRGEDIAFGLAPRINAAGRLRDLGADMITRLARATSDREAETLAEELNKLNETRKEIEREGTTVARAKVEAKIRDQGELPNCIVVADKSFHQGVVGIIASRIKDAYNRPTFVFAWDDDVQAWKGSGRGVDSDVVSISDALFDRRVKRFHRKSDEKPAAKAGGHKKAGGATIYRDDLDGFTEALDIVFGEQIGDHDITPYVRWDVETNPIELNQIGTRLLDQLEDSFEPCGAKNLSPRFLMRGLTITSIRGLKRDGEPGKAGGKPRHLLLRLRKEPEPGQNLLDKRDKFIDATLWFHDSHPDVRIGNTIDLVAELTRNERRADFNFDRQRIQLNLVTIEGAAEFHETPSLKTSKKTASMSTGNRSSKKRTPRKKK